ncbi:MAG: Multifunctional fusion protein [Ignavibacteria bacterium]|nr:Multifunctional fusion protein [Ignavibacteria bacterium]
MKYILTPDEMRSADTYAINNFGIPSALLMENAARSASLYIEELLFPESRITIFCGSGNNGGDGFALARHLADKFHVKIYWIGTEDKMSPETKTNYLAAKNIGIPTIYLSDENELTKIDWDTDCLIDALIGVGGSENIRGLALDIIRFCNEQPALKIAIDAPTGLNTKSGKAHRDCFQADYTITMFAIKTGMLLNDGVDKCGEILIANLGAPSKIVKDISKIRIIEKADKENFLQKRPRKSSKFDYGRIVIVAGSQNMPGAAALASNAAITAGAGLVYLFTPSVHPALLPEVIPNVVPVTPDGTISIHALDAVLQAIEKADVLAIGPGFGNNTETIKFTKELLAKTPERVSMIIDADGLLAISPKSQLRKNIILTPHTGEFSKITGITRSEIEINSVTLATEWAERLGCIIHLKYFPSISTDGTYSYWNIAGNPGMATAGSGDVLTGIIAALLGQKLPALDAAGYGAYLHAIAGDYYTSTYPEETLTASSVIECLKEVMISKKLGVLKE